MSEVNSVKIGDTVWCNPEGSHVLPPGLPAGAIAEIEATYTSQAYGTVTYVNYRNKVFKVPNDCIHPVSATFAM